MGLGGIGAGTLLVVLVIVVAFLGLVMAALVKYVFGLGKGDKSRS